MKSSKGEVPKIIVDFGGASESHAEQEITNEVIIYESQEVEEQDPLQMDHQYVSSTEMQSSQDAQLTDYAKKEMDVFDYIGIEIKNIQELERKQKLENEDTLNETVKVSEPQLEDEPEMEVQEMMIEDAEYFDTTEIVEAGESTFLIEQLEEVRVLNFEEEQHQQDQEFLEFVQVEDDKTFACKLCPKIYQKRNITTKHLKSVHGIFLSNYNYEDANRHRKPQKKLSFKCHYCPKRYTSSRLAETHEALHGPEGNLVHKCSCCPQYFSNSKSRDSHQYSNHSERLICKVEECKKKFDHPEKLVNHVKYAHDKTKTPKHRTHFECPLCGRNFNTRVALSDHERSNCGKDPIYKCNFCDRNYHSSGSLKCHITVHSNSLEFACQFCKKGFRTKGQLTVHLRSHTKEKNFKCLHCPAEFSHRESLLTHNSEFLLECLDPVSLPQFLFLVLALHTGIKRFECSSCESRFSCISNLQAHRRSHKDTCGSSETRKVENADSSVKMCRAESDSDK